MNESNHKQKIVTLLVDIGKGKNKTNLFEYPELDALFDEGMYIESFNLCHVYTSVLSFSLIALNHFPCRNGFFMGTFCSN